MKHSSIDWLIEQLTEVDYGCINNTFLQMNNTLSTHIMKDIFKKAKAMHKEEIIAARVDGDTWSTAYKEMRENYAEIYYNETFNTEEK